MADIDAIVDLALTQQGKQYRFGAQPAASDPNPWAFDCSSFVRWCCDRNGVSPPMEPVTYYQHIACINAGTIISLDEGLATRGALLFIHRDLAGNPKTPTSPVNPSSFGRAHVAFSLGGGQTMEAMGTLYGVRIASTAGRGWTAAARVPGADYAGGDSPPPPPPPPDPSMPEPRTDKPYLRRGAQGSAVVEMQRRLITTGLAPRLAAVGATGRFLDITNQAVRAFQSYVRGQYGDTRMVVDGECGPITWAWLLRLTGG
jgi:NlpC/P60 family